MEGFLSWWSRWKRINLKVSECEKFPISFFMLNNWDEKWSIWMSTTESRALEIYVARDSQIQIFLDKIHISSFFFNGLHECLVCIWRFLLDISSLHEINEFSLISFYFMPRFGGFTPFTMINKSCECLFISSENPCDSQPTTIHHSNAFTNNPIFVSFITSSSFVLFVFCRFLAGKSCSSLRKASHTCASIFTYLFFTRQPQT